jgi:hypothetical protein
MKNTATFSEVVKKNDSVGHICYLKLEVALTYKKINAEF